MLFSNAIITYIAEGDKNIKMSVSAGLIDLFSWAVAVSVSTSSLILVWAMSAIVIDQTGDDECPERIRNGMIVCAAGLMLSVVFSYTLGCLSQVGGYKRNVTCLSFGSLWWFLQIVQTIIFVTMPGFALIGSTESRVDESVVTNNSTGYHTSQPLESLEQDNVRRLLDNENYEFISDPSCTRTAPRIVYAMSILLPLVMLGLSVIVNSSRYGLCGEGYSRANERDSDGDTDESGTQFTSNPPVPDVPPESSFSVTDEATELTFDEIP